MNRNEQRIDTCVKDLTDLVPTLNTEASIKLSKIRIKVICNETFIETYFDSAIFTDDNDKIVKKILLDKVNEIIETNEELAKSNCDKFDIIVSVLSSISIDAIDYYEELITPISFFKFNRKG